ncbi:mobilization protein [Ectothiorhodospiraceae bacterium BW-2]|nr:mobilization protein [Ectothiorhodospiraceae bacterium BW-2]
MARIHFIGGEKGGIGKSVLARALAQYYLDRDKPFSAFDGDLSHGALIRYYADYAQPVDISHFESADKIIEVTVEHGCDVIVDLAAQSSRNIDQWMSESGLMEITKEIDIVTTFWHVMDDGTDAIRLLEKTLNSYQSAPEYILVRNRGCGSDFTPFEKSEAKIKADSFGAKIIDLPKLHASAMRKIDRIGASLWAAANNKDEAVGPTLGLLERQRVKVWLNKTYAEFDRVLT